MSPDNSADPRRALEPSLTALVLGELTEDQARFVRQAIASDPELARTFERLKQTAELIRETENQRVTTPAAPPIAPKLSEARRQELLAGFKTVRPEPFKKPARLFSSRLVSVAAAIALMLVIAAALLPTLSRSKTRSMAQRRITEGDEPLRRRMITASGGAAAPVSSGSRPLDKFDVAQDEAKKRLVELSTHSATPLQQTIVLPTETAVESLQLSPSPQQDANTVALHFESPAYVIAGVVKANAPATAGAGGVAGGAADSRNQVPSLGDTPLLGGRFAVTSKDVKESELAPKSASEERLLRETQPAEPQAEPAKLDASSLAAVAAPDSAFLQASSGVTRNTQPVGQVGYDARQQTGGFGLDSLSSATALPSPSPELALGRRYRPTDVETGQKLAAATLNQEKEKVDRPVLKSEVARVEDRFGEFEKQRDNLVRTNQVRGLAENRIDQLDVAAAKPASISPVPQPEVQTPRQPVLDVLAQCERRFVQAGGGQPGKRALCRTPAGMRSEEFINAFDYHDPEPAPGAPVGFAWERAQYPFAQNRDVLRLSIRTAAAGRQAGRPLNLVLLLDNSGSMERADRVRIIHEALRCWPRNLQPQDKLSVVDVRAHGPTLGGRCPGNQAGQVADELSALTPEGGTNLEEAMNLAYQTALRHYPPNGINRVVLLTDGAANLGDSNPEALKQKVEAQSQTGHRPRLFRHRLGRLQRRPAGNALAERRRPVRIPQHARSSRDGICRAACRRAAGCRLGRESPGRVQPEPRHGLSPDRLCQASVDEGTVSRQRRRCGRDRSRGVGQCRVCARDQSRRVPAHWPRCGCATRCPEPRNTVNTSGSCLSPAPRRLSSKLAPRCGWRDGRRQFSESLAGSPFAAEVSYDRLLGSLNGVPAAYPADPGPRKLEWMIRQTQALKK